METPTNSERLDAVLVACGFVLMVGLGNGQMVRKTGARAAVPAGVAERKQAQHLQWTGMFRRWADGAKKLPLAVKILLTLFIAAAAVLLGTAVVFFACGIACSGSEALAILFFFGGMAAVIWGAVVLLSDLYRGPRGMLRVQRRRLRRDERKRSRRHQDAAGLVPARL